MFAEGGDKISDEGLSIWAGEEASDFTPVVDIVLVQGLASHPNWAWTATNKNHEKRQTSFSTSRFLDSFPSSGSLKQTSQSESAWQQNGNHLMSGPLAAQNDVFWPYHLLPFDFPNARISTYAYKSDWKSSRFKTNLDECGDQMLTKLAQHRQSSSAQRRPIVFIGHSFGGLVIESALVSACLREDFSNIRRLTAGFIFLGCPFGGTDVAKLVSAISKMVRNRQPNLDALKPGSPELFKLSQDFLGQYKHLPTVCFYEKLPSSSLKVLVVTQQSATISPGTKSIPMHTDHRGLSKFYSADEAKYLDLKFQLNHLVEFAKSPDFSMMMENGITPHMKRFIRGHMSVAIEKARERRSLRSFGATTLSSSGSSTKPMRQPASHHRDRKEPQRHRHTQYGSDLEIQRPPRTSRGLNYTGRAEPDHSNVHRREQPDVPFETDVDSTKVSPVASRLPRSLNPTVGIRLTSRHHCRSDHFERKGEVKAKAGVRASLHTTPARSGVAHFEDPQTGRRRSGTRIAFQQSQSQSFQDHSRLDGTLPIVAAPYHLITDDGTKGQRSNSKILSSTRRTSTDRMHDSSAMSQPRDRNVQPLGQRRSSQKPGSLTYPFSAEFAKDKGDDVIEMKELLIQPRDESQDCQQSRVLMIPPEDDCWGRENIIQELHEYTRIARPPIRLALTGLAGVGKSCVARKFAHRIMKQFPNHSILWMDGRLEDKLQRSCHKVADTLSLRCLTDSAWHNLTLIRDRLDKKSPQGWLMILDGVEMAGNQDTFQKFCRTQGSPNGYTIMTTMRLSLAQSFLGGSGKRVPVGTLGPVFAGSMLSTRPPAPLSGDHDFLAHLVDFLPAALIAARTFQERCGMTASDFVERLKASLEPPRWIPEDDVDPTQLQTSISVERSDAWDMSSDSTEFHICHSVSITWLALFDQLDKNHPEAVLALSSLCVFGRERVPQLLLNPPGQQPYASAAIQTLVDYSIMSPAVDPDGSRWYELRKLLLLAMRFWLRRRDRRQHAEQASLSLLASAYTNARMTENWPDYRILDPFADTVLQVTRGCAYDDAMRARRDRASLFRKRSEYFLHNDLDPAFASVLGAEEKKEFAKLSNLQSKSSQAYETS